MTRIVLKRNVKIRVSNLQNDTQEDFKTHERRNCKQSNMKRNSWAPRRASSERNDATWLSTALAACPSWNNRNQRQKRVGNGAKHNATGNDLRRTLLENVGFLDCDEGGECDGDQPRRSTCCATHIEIFQQKLFDAPTHGQACTAPE